MDKEFQPENPREVQVSSKSRMSIFIFTFLQFVCLAYTFFTCCFLNWFGYCFWYFSLFHIERFMPFYSVQSTNNIWFDEIIITKTDSNADIIELYCEDIENTIDNLVLGTKIMLLGLIMTSIAYILNICLFIHKFFNPNFRMKYVIFIILLPLILQCIFTTCFVVLGRLFQINKVNTWGQIGDLSPTNFDISVGFALYLATICLEACSACYAISSISKIFK